MSFSLASRIKLNNGLDMPRIQLGVYMMSRKEASSAVTAALQLGYRAIDTAQWYGNEREVGQAIKQFLAANNLPRSAVHYTTKLKDCTDYEAASRSIKQSVQVSGLGHVDLFLLHSPYGGKEARLSSWRAVEDAISEGHVKSGGISNFGVRHVQELLAACRTKPAVNQIEMHPFNNRDDIASFCREHDIVVEAYAPLVRAMRMTHPRLVEVSKRCGCTPAQLLVRWSLQHGYVPLPKSTRKERIAENGAVEGINISDDDMALLDKLDEHLVTDWDPTDAE